MKKILHAFGFYNNSKDLCNQLIPSLELKNRKKGFVLPLSVNNRIQFYFVLLIAILLNAGNASGAISQRGTATTAYNSGSNSFTISKPTGVVVGDVMIMNIVKYTSGNTDNPFINGDGTAGWTVIASQGLSGSTEHIGTLMYKVVTETWEPASYTIVPSNWANADNAAASIVAFSGVDASTPFDAIGVFNTTSVVNQSTITPAGITTISSNSLVMMLSMNFRMAAGTRSYTGWTATSPATFTEIYDFAGTDRVRVGAATATKAAAGATGDGTITLNNNNSYRGGILLALKPAPPKQFRTKYTGNWTTLGLWEQSTDGGSTWVNATSTPTNSDGLVTIVSGHTITVPNGTNATASDLLVNGNMILAGTATLTPNDATVNGSITVQSTSSLNAGTGIIAFANGSSYIHARNGGTIPTATWDANSNCNITGVTNTVPTVASFAQSFGNFTWNCTSQTADVSLIGNLTTINGNFSILSTGGTPQILNLAISGISFTTTIAGNFIQSGGNLTLNGTNGACTLNLLGNFNMSGGTLARGAGTGVFNFSGTSTQLFSKSGGTITGTLPFSINSGATVDFGTSVLNGTGATFNLNSGAEIITAHAQGLSTTAATGSIQVTGTKTYNNAANYTYNGTAAQVTGNGLTGANNLTINNSAGVTLSRAIAVSGTLTLDGATLRSGATTGYAITGTGILDVASNSTIALGTGVHTLNFANSSAKNWAASSLTITGWTGTAGAVGTAGKIVVGAGGLSAIQLPKINFNGFAAGAAIVSTEVVPSVSAPTITGVSPSSVCVGNTVTITGTNFTSATSVKFNGVAATSFTVASATSITAIPASATTGTITVTTPAGTATSSTSITIYSPLGDETTFGAGSWIGYAYESSVAGGFSKYIGYVTENEIFDRDFDTSCAGSVCGLTTDLCSTPSNLFAIRYKMTKTFPAGSYTFTIGGDDGVRLYVNGNLLINGWVDQSYTSYTGTICLDGSTNLILEFYENGGQARVSFNYSSSSTTSITTQSTAAQTKCMGASFNAISITVAGTEPFAYQWYSNTSASNTGGSSLGEANGAQTNSYTPQSGTAGTLYYYCIVTSTCGSATSAVSGAFIVNPAIVSNTINYTNSTPGTICGISDENQSVVLTAPTGSVFNGVSFASYGTPNGTCPNFTVDEACHASTSQSVVEFYVLDNNTASIPATNAVFTDPCYGIFKRLYVSATYPQVCTSTFPGPITGSTPTGGDESFTYSWTSSITSASGGFGIELDTGKDYTPSTLTQTTWYRRTVTSGGCSSTSNVIQITVSPIPTTPVGATNGSICGNGTVTISVTDPGIGLTIDWYENSTGGSILNGGSGTASFITPTIAVTTIYYAETRNTSTNCVSATRTAVTATVNPIPATPINLEATPATICKGGSAATLSADVSTGETVDWFTGSCGGTAVSNTVSPMATTVYYARARNTTTGCVSAACASTTVTVSTPSVAITTPYIEDCPELIPEQGFEPNNTGYDAGSTKITYEVALSGTSATTWSFNYAITGTNVSVRTSGVPSPNFAQSDNIVGTSNNPVVLTFYINNNPPIELYPTLEITNISDGNGCGANNPTPLSVTIKAMPEVGEYE